MSYRIGDIVEGVITGIQPYGAFVHIDYEHTGLIHISELSDRFVKDVTNFVQVGEIVRVKIIDKDDSEHFKLSLKAANKSTSRMKEAYQMKDNLPPSEKGFQTLKDILPQWIKESK